jgi:hypothetical protein
MNVANLELTLVQKINNSVSTLDTLIYSKALQELKTGAVTTVDSYSQLPTATASLLGLLFYVKNEEAFYHVVHVFSSYEWATLRKETFGVFSWGNNGSGRLGDGTTTSRSSPGTVAGGGTTWYAASAGCAHTAAIKIDGTLWTWGCNNSGQLGDGTATSRSSPGTVAGGGTTWCFVSAGADHIAAVKTDGTLWTWGANSSGQLGDGTTTGRSSPGTTAGGGTNWCFVVASSSHSAGIKTDGTLWTWGFNTSGQLGDGTATSRLSPVTVAGGGTTWRTVSARGDHTVAVKTDGTLWTWGANGSGQLGEGTNTGRSSPGTVAGGGTTWCAASAGCSNTAAIKTDGTLWTWGCNTTTGQLGDGTTTNRSSPVTTAGGGTTWCAASVGRDHTAAVKTDGTLWTWGGNNAGQLGNGTATSRSSPGTVAGGGTTWRAVDAGFCYTVARSTF